MRMPKVTWMVDDIEHTGSEPVADGFQPLPIISQWDEDPILFEVHKRPHSEYGPHWTVERDGVLFCRWDKEEDAEMTAMFWNEPRDNYDWYDTDATPVEGWQLIVDESFRVDLLVEKIRSEQSNDDMLGCILSGLSSWFLPMRRTKGGHTLDIFDESTFDWEDGCWWEPCVKENIQTGWYDHTKGDLVEFVGPQRRPLSQDNAADLHHCFNVGMEYTEMDTCGYISSFGLNLGYHEDYSSFTDVDQTWKSAMWTVHGTLDWTNAPKILADIRKRDEDYRAMLVRNNLLKSDGYSDWEKMKELEDKGELI